MKVVSINANYSKPGEIAMLTHPIVSAIVFAKLQSLWQSSPYLHSNPVKLEGSLFIFRVDVVTAEIASEIQKLLDAAEKTVMQDAVAAQQKADAEKIANHNRIEAAANVFGVPVQ